MNIPEEMNINRQLAVLEELMPEYHGRTLDNIIQNLKARRSYYENH